MSKLGMPHLWPTSRRATTTFGTKNSPYLIIEMTPLVQIYNIKKIPE